MYTVQTKEDLEKINQELAPETHHYLTQQLDELMTHLTSGTEMECTSLANYGYRIILLEQLDSLDSLQSQFNCNGLGSVLLHPEYIEMDTLGNGTQTYRIAIMEDNESMTLLYSLVDSLHPTVEEWIIEISVALL